AFAAPATDISGHWAEKVITQWQEKGLISGYEDGTFKPDNSVTRAEFVIMLNKALGFTQKGNVTFSDVSANAWYYDAVAIAVEAGYCAGYEDGTFKPNATITRAEAAVMIAKAKELTANTEAADKFTDASRIPAWARGSVGAVSAAGFMTGRTDGTFDATNTITRAEAVSSLDRTMEKEETDEEAKDVVVTEDDTVIEGQTIEGNLIIDKAVGEGEVYVNDTTVKGDVIVRGGGDDSIYFDNVSVKGKVSVEKENVRLQLKGDTDISVIEVKEACNIEGKDFTGTVDTISITNEIGTSNKVTIGVPANRVDEKASVVVKEDVKKLVISEDAVSSKVEVAKDATVKTVVADAKVSITGSGQIEKLEANADGITISSSTDVKDTEVADGVDKPSTSTGSSGGGGSSSSGGSSVSVADKLLTATSSAISYKYEDYTYTSQLTHTKDGKNAIVMGEYAAEDILSGAAMNDMARYLGALYRFDNGTTVKSITYGDTEFTWSSNLDPALKGSNWAKDPNGTEADGNTLVSIIVDDFQAGKIQDAIQLTLKGSNGSTITLRYGFTVKEDETAKALMEATKSAIAYQYDDYEYTSQLTHTVDGKNAVVSGRYDTMETVLSGASMNDMARYLGALYRFDNGATVKSITYNQETYTWSDNLDPALKGSNWVKNPEASEAEGNTLVSVIVDEFQAGKIQDAITFTLEGTDGSALTLQYGFIVGEVTANNSDTLKAALANPSVETVKVSDDITLDEAVNVDRQVTIEVNEGAQLNLNDSFSIGEKVTLINKGTITNNGTMTNNGSFDTYEGKLAGTGQVIVADGAVLKINANYNNGADSMLPTVTKIEVQPGGELQSMTTDGGEEATTFVGVSSDARIQTNGATVTFGFADSYSGTHPTMEIEGDVTIPAGQTWYTMFDSATEAIGIEMILNGNMTVDGTLKVVSANSTGSELLLKENAVLAVNGTITTAAKGKVTGTDATSVVSIAEGAAGTDTFAAGSTYNWNGSAWEVAVVENEHLTEEESDVKEATVVEMEQVNPEEITAVTLTEEV
ncbi:S-layer homology domain-containing protein, partial [Anaerotignum lactatifermentans]